MRNAVGEPGPALIEEDDAAEIPKLAEPARQTRLVPRIFDMGNEARRHDELGALAEDLIGDMDVAALGVTRCGLGSSADARLRAIPR